MQLIALYSNAPQAGKGTVAQVLMQQGYRPVSFAEPLKKMLEVFLSYWVKDKDKIQRMLYGDLKDEVIAGLDKNSRQLMQALGTDWGRDTVHPEVWVMTLEQRVKRLLAAGRKVVVDDLRFPNEMDRIVAMGGVCWQIDRTAVGKTYGHASEGSLKDRQFRAVITNNGSVDELRLKVQLHLNDPTLTQISMNLSSIQRATLDVDKAESVVRSG